MEPLLHTKKQLLAVALVLDLVSSCQRPTAPLRAADYAYSLSDVIRVQQMTHMRPCNPGTRIVVSDEDITRTLQGLKSDHEFLRIVVGIKLLRPAARAQLMQDSRSIRIACGAPLLPAVLTTEQKLANAIVNLADKMADRVPGPEIESTIRNVQHKRWRHVLFPLP